ncbi:MAG: stalk domain-containing protein, partial [Acidimicrobiia bacterium]
MKARNWSVAALAALVLLAGVSVLLSAQPSSITVISREGRKPLPVTTINNQDYVAVDDINTAFGTSSREDRLAGGLTISARNRSIVLTENQNVVSVAGRHTPLPAPPVRRDSRWFVPADFVPRALGTALELRLDLRRSARLLIVGDLRVPRVVARVDAGASNVAVTLEITPQTETRV